MKQCCENPDIHEELLSSVMERMPDENMLIDLSDLFKMFSDHSRLKILYALYLSEMSVCDLANMLEMSQSAVSHQLRLLRVSRNIQRFQVMEGPGTGFCTGSFLYGSGHLQ